MSFRNILCLISRQFNRQHQPSNQLKFRYHPLKHFQEIRILQIEPSSNGDEVACSLHHVSLGDAPNYRALSYTWGTGLRTHQISCNNSVFNVTENLYQALYRFRERDSPTRFWIDQICVNQEDLQERSKQVQLMGSIYCQAERVMIWLGEANKNSVIGMRLARLLLKVLDENPGIDLEVKNLEALGLPEWNHGDWNALGGILRRRWFRRIWVVQEVVMSRKATVVCGEDELYWSRLVHLVRSVRFASHLQTFGGSETMNARPVQSIIDIDRMRNPRIRGNKLILLDSLMNFRSFESADPRDKVYALLGMSPGILEPDYDMLMLKFRSSESAEPRDKILALSGVNPGILLPDYSMPVEKVFVLAAVFLITQHMQFRGKYFVDRVQWQHCMGLIFSAGRAHQRRTLPSWVPDWSTDLETRPLWTGMRGEHYAGGKVRGEIKLLPGNRLQISGKIFDTIATISSPDDRMPQHEQQTADESSSEETLHTSMATWIFDADNLVFRLPKHYPTGESIRQAFKRTLMANRVPTGTSYRQATLFDVEQFYQGLRYLYNLRMSRTDLQMSSGWILPDSAHTSWYQNIFQETKGRLFFVTEKGYLGLAPKGTTIGDLVGVLRGGDVPVVVREEGGEFVLVGEAYVHGVMKGEVMKMVGIPERNIILR